VFLLDGSDDVSVEDFFHMKTIAQVLMNIMQISQDGFHVGLTVYGHDPNIGFSLNTHNSLQSAQSALLQAPKSQGRPRLGHALHSLWNDQFTEAAGSRSHLGNPQVVIILTASDSTDDVMTQSKKLKDNGVIIFALGAGKANQDELQLAGSTPAQKFVFFHSDFARLGLEMHKMVRGLAEADVVFLLDGSGNGGQAEFQQMKRVVEVLLGVMNIHPSIVRVGLVQYGHQPRSEFYLNTYETANDMQVALKHIQPLGGPSNLHEGLALLRREQFVETSGGRANEGAIQVRQYFWMLKLYFIFETFGELRLSVNLLGDISSALANRKSVEIPSGDAVGPSNFELIRLLASQVIFGLDIEPQRTHAAVVQYASTPQTEFNLNAFTSKSDLAAALQHVQDKVMVKEKGSRGDIGAPQVVLILMGSSPDNFAAAKKASKTLQEKGVIVLAIGAGSITEGDPQMTYFYFIFSAVDLVFLLDGSRDIELSEFDLMKQMVETIVGVLDVGQEKTQVGLVQYGGQPRSEFYLNTYRSNGEIIDALKNIKLKGGQSNLRQGLELLRRDQFIERRGGRGAKGAPQVVIIFTGSSPDDFEAAKKVSNALQLRGVTVMAIGAGRAKPDELQSLVSEPAYKMAIYRPSFEGFGSCSASDPETEKADIVFLVDGSWSVGMNNFQLLRDFIISLIKGMVVGKDRVRIGLSQYSSNPEMEFPLKNDHTKEEILEYIRNWKYKGGNTFTGAALEFLTRNHFTEEAGSRRYENAPQVLSQDDMVPSAEVLKASGVVLYAIGIANAPRQKLEEANNYLVHELKTARDVLAEGGNSEEHQIIIRENK
uniref:VWFA domain-containing protein n=1 Tax=Eptatretus burgeri TaxID=7764 RepID=A0A8C4NH85_EPTBU